MSLICDDFSIVGGAADPVVASNPKFWITIDSLALANNDPISSWASKVAGVNTPTSTSGREYVYTTGVTNGKPAAYNDGTKSLTSTSALSTLFAANAKTVIIVAKLTNLGKSPHGWILRDSALKFFIRTYPGQPFMYTNHDGSYDQNYVTPTQGVTAVFSYRHTGTNHSVRINNGAWKADQATGSTSSLTGTIYIGDPTDGSGNNNFVGYLFDLITWDRVLSDDEFNAIYAKYATKYAL